MLLVLKIKVSQHVGHKAIYIYIYRTTIPILEKNLNSFREAFVCDAFALIGSGRMYGCMVVPRE